MIHDKTKKKDERWGDARGRLKTKRSFVGMRTSNLKSDTNECTMSSGESTPLVSGSSGGGPLDDVNRFVSNIFSKENLDRAKENLGIAGNAAMGQLNNLQRSASEGDFSIRLLALVAGVLLVVSAFFSFFELLLSFKLSNAILEIYTFGLGLIILLLESHGHLRKQQQRLSTEERQQMSTQVNFLDNLFRNVFKYVMLLKFVWGRGCLYFVSVSWTAQVGWMRASLSCCSFSFNRSQAACNWPKDALWII
jgi:hypothetical protein